MKIAILSDSVFTHFKGGKEKRWDEISRRLAAKGHDVHIYCMKWWKGKKVRKVDGVTYHAISPLYPLYNKDGSRSIKEALGFALHTFPGLIKEKFDILDVDQMPYFQIFPAWLVAKLKGKPMVVTWHEYWGKYFFQYMGAKGIFGYFIEKLSDLFSPRVIAVSKLTHSKIKTKKKYLIPNGIDIKHFESIKPSKKKYDLVYDGRLMPHKNVDLLIKVANKHKYKTLIMGTGPEEQRLRKLAGKTVEFTGFVKDHDDVIANTKSAKVYVSLSEREGFGITILQALSCGVPVVTSNHKNNAGRHLIKNDWNGQRAKLTIESVEKAIESCLKNPQMKKNAIQSAKHFDWNHLANETEKVYQNA